MPTYSYACTQCTNRFDVAQAFTDDALTTCDNCSGRLRKIFGSVGVVFKGSGFYRTDSRDSNKSSVNSSGNGQANSAASESGSGSGSSDKSTTTEKSSAPAKTEKASSGSTAAAAS